MTPSFWLIFLLSVLGTLGTITGFILGYYVHKQGVNNEHNRVD